MFKPVQRQAARQLRQSIHKPAAVRAYASASNSPAPQSFDWKDPLAAANLFTEEELAIAETAEAYCQERMLPRVLGMCTQFTDAHDFD